MQSLLVESYMNRLVKKIIDKIDSSDNRCLSSVILTGSLGRNEGTFHMDYSTSDVVLDSDVELALVYKFGMKKRAEVIRNRLIKDFNEEINPMVISESRVRNGYNFNYSIMRPKYFSIFMYDLYYGSRTIWGKNLLCKSIQTYDKYEAKRIVANRIGELIYLETAIPGNPLDLINQWEAKLLLAIGSAYCILESAYVSQYKEQNKFIVENKNKVNKLLGEDFAYDYNLAYLYLREGLACCKFSREKLQKYVENIKVLFDKSGISTARINSCSRKLKYAISCVKFKINMNPFNCEERIIDSLVNYFISGDSRINLVAQYWKYVLY